MNRATIPGIILAVIGIILFAHQGIAQATQKRILAEASTIHQSKAIQLPEQKFPIASLLAGFLFMSGIGLVAISAHPPALPRHDDPDAQS
ncbi:MAG: hypothetical protein WB987_08915 [Candidatus Acidiferrales bacterium]